MPIETLTYAALGVRLKISPQAARSLAKRLRLPRVLSDDGKALVSVDLADIRHEPRPPGRSQAGNVVAVLRARITTLEAETARLEVAAAGHRADFERERERADRLLVELLQANAEAAAAKEAAARLAGSVRTASAIDSQGQAARRLGHLAADLVAGDRKAAR